MTNKGPVEFEGAVTGEPEVGVDGEGRKVDPEKDEPKEKVRTIPMDQHMARILEHVPEALHERVSTLTRAELSMPGVPRDREAYEAYLMAEKIIRDIRRREEKANLDFSNVPKMKG